MRLVMVLAMVLGVQTASAAGFADSFLSFMGVDGTVDMFAVTRLDRSYAVFMGDYSATHQSRFDEFMSEQDASCLGKLNREFPLLLKQTRNQEILVQLFAKANQTLAVTRSYGTMADNATRLMERRALYDGMAIVGTFEAPSSAHLEWWGGRVNARISAHEAARDIYLVDEITFQPHTKDWGISMTLKGFDTRACDVEGAVRHFFRSFDRAMDDVPSSSSTPRVRFSQRGVSI